MRVKLICALIAALLMLNVFDAPTVSAQGQTPTPVPMPAPNVLLIYDKTTVAVINTSPGPISLAGVSFMRAGGVVKFNAQTMITNLPAGHCFQVWTTEIRQLIGKPDECAVRDRWQRLANANSYFWAAGYDGEPFRPQLRTSSLKVCKAAFNAVERCAFYLPQGDDAKKPWIVLDPETNEPLPAGIQVAYDPNQIWIANLTPNTVLTTKALRLFYKANGQDVVWTPSKQETWDGTKWEGQGLKAGECLLLYQDPAKIIQLLPCTPVLKAVRADTPWKVKFEVMGPREERHTACGSDQPPAGPVLCVIGG
jgi:hypothetical protein